ncbi:MAG: outer membrane protein assembly factor BamD [Myxococcales bacterium]|nr:outer membrane protein assembly factor BamD [Myxococcales bacterium]
MRILIGLALVPLLLTLGCNKQQTDRSYAGTAKYRYELGMEALDDGNYIEAIQHFTLVKNKFTYSQYAALAELRIADAYFDQDKQIEAIDGYRTFVQRRPNHPDVPYALYRIGLSYYQQIPSGFFLFPPPFEKDQSATKDALRSFREYVDRFPQHEKVDEALGYILECRRLMADYELFVARFYLGQDRPVSARGRLETVMHDFEDVPERWRDGMQLLIETYRALDQDAEAREAARALIAKAPRSDEADDARKMYPNLR